MRNILICGDSFAVDYEKYNVSEPGMKPPHKGWPNYLAEKHNVTNVATPGVGQWKIWKQVDKADLDKFDTVIVSVGTPNRVYCKSHPIHKEGMHKHSDLMYMDIDRRSWFNKELTTAKNWFLYFYDQEYQDDLYEMITEKMLDTIKDKNYILLGHNYSRILGHHYTKIDFDDPHFIDCGDLWTHERGSVNHYNHTGAIEILKRVEARL